MPKLIAVALSVVLIVTLAHAAGVSAQQDIDVIADDARNEFPTGVTFTVTFNAPAPAAEVRLRYELAPDGTGASATAQCTEAAATTCSYTLTSGRGIFIIPGAQITHHWDIEDEDGNQLSTPERVYVHEDTRFDFRTISAGNVTVYFHAGTEGDAPTVLDAALQTLAEIGELEQTEVTFPVKVFLYETASEMQPAIVPTGGRGVTILGEVVYSDTAMVSADVSVLDITRHEIAHIVTREATKGAFGIPDWLNEGISVYAETGSLRDFDTALDNAIRLDRVLSMAQLNSPTVGDSTTAGLYYAQGGSIVSYLVNTHGPEKFAELLRVFKAGSTNDDAFETVYGFDEFGLENLWRESLGLPPRTQRATTTAEATEEAAAQPTRASGSSGGSGAVDDGDGGGDGSRAIFIVVAAILVVMLGGSSFVLYRVARERI